jgi:hypothetical protein
MRQDADEDAVSAEEMYGNLRASEPATAQDEKTPLLQKKESNDAANTPPPSSANVGGTVLKVGLSLTPGGVTRLVACTLPAVSNWCFARAPY